MDQFLGEKGAKRDKKKQKGDKTGKNGQKEKKGTKWDKRRKKGTNGTKGDKSLYNLPLFPFQSLFVVRLIKYPTKVPVMQAVPMLSAQGFSQTVLVFQISKKL